MNKQQIQGKIEQIGGKVKEELGDVIGNTKLVNEGIADQMKGAARETVGNVKQAAQNAAGAVVGEHKDKVHGQMNKALHSLNDHMEHAKDTVDQKLGNIQSSHRDGD